MRIALVNLDDVVRRGVATTVRHAGDIEIVDVCARDRVFVDVVMVDPAVHPDEESALLG